MVRIGHGRNAIQPGINGQVIVTSLLNREIR